MQPATARVARLPFPLPARRPAARETRFMSQPAPSHRPLLAGRSLPVRIVLLVVLSIVGGTLLELIHLPAALLLGPMIAAVFVAAVGGNLKLPNKAFLFAQGIVGLLITRSVSSSMLHAMRSDWLLLLVSVLAVIGASTAMGWVLARMRIMPGSTAIWGLSPGAAATMVVLAEAYGADMRLTAFMQYLRVVMVTVVATVVSSLWVAHVGTAAPIVWFPPMNWLAFGYTLLLAGGGAALGRALRIPAGSLLLPLIAGAVLHGVYDVAFELPPWFLALNYAVMGWSIGLRFNRGILLHAARVFPVVALVTLLLIAACGLLAVLLHWGVGIDPLTAYLATSPGGLDAVAIIAASSKSDVSFVMSMQIARLIVVIIAGPGIARFVADRLPPEDKPVDAT